MEITEVKVFPVHEDKLKAYITIVLDDCFVVRDLKVISGVTGLCITPRRISAMGFLPVVVRGRPGAGGGARILAVRRARNAPSTGSRERFSWRWPAGLRCRSADGSGERDRAAPFLERRPLLVVSDFDGTLAPLVDDPMTARMTPRARAAGAANTLIRTDDGWRGANTDGAGLSAALRQDLGAELAGSPLGAGPRAAP